MKMCFSCGQRVCLLHAGLAFALMIWLAAGSKSLGADPGGPPPRDRDRAWDEPAGPRGPDARPRDLPPRGPEADGPRRFRGGEDRPMPPRQPRGGEDGWDGPRMPRGPGGRQYGMPPMRGPEGDGPRRFRGGEGGPRPFGPPLDRDEGWDGPRAPRGPGGGRFAGPPAANRLDRLERKIDELLRYVHRLELEIRRLSRLEAEFFVPPRLDGRQRGPWPPRPAREPDGMWDWRGPRPGWSAAPPLRPRPGGFYDLDDLDDLEE